MVSRMTGHLFESKKVYKRTDNHSKINQASFSNLLSYRLIYNCAPKKQVRHLYITGTSQILYRGFEYNVGY